MKDLHDNHEPSTHFVKSAWLKVKCLDIEMKCKQSHAVKCSFDCQKCLVDRGSKQTHMGTHAVHMCHKVTSPKSSLGGRFIESWWELIAYHTPCVMAS